MDVYARWEANTAKPTGAAVLLEGSWPANRVTATAPRWSLDELVDARLARLDAAAVELAERVGGLETLRLRYFLIKLLRAVWFFRQGPGCDVEHLRAHLTLPHDNDYAELLTAIAQTNGASLEIIRQDGPAPATVRWPENGAWRRLAGKLLARPPRPQFNVRPAVVLVGDANRLDPVCAAVLRHGYQPWWLYDRFAIGAWWRWRRRNVSQLICNSDRPTGADASPVAEPPCCEPAALTWGGVDLTPAVNHWLQAAERAQGERLGRLSQRLSERLEAVAPSAVILDEDVTPLARAAVHWARSSGVPSLVVQHGAPCVRFGFARPLADRTCVWGEASRRQLMRWGVPAESIRVTGFPGLPTMRTNSRRTSPGKRQTMRVLLLGTVPPRDDRPDSAEFCLTGQRYRHLFRGACEALAETARQWASGASTGVAFRRVQLVVRPHPRSSDDAVLTETLAQFPELRPRIVRGNTLRQAVRRADVAIGCASSSVVEAAYWSVPAIQLMPDGSAIEVFDADHWGLAATCRAKQQLQAALVRLLPEIVAGRAAAPVGISQAIAATGVVSAENVVREMRSLIAERRMTVQRRVTEARQRHLEAVR